jgi:hypothetical protein
VTEAQLDSRERKRAYDRERMRGLRARRKAAGVCTRCGRDEICAPGYDAKALEQCGQVCGDECTGKCRDFLASPELVIARVDGSRCECCKMQQWTYDLIRFRVRELEPSYWIRY